MEYYITIINKKGKAIYCRHFNDKNDMNFAVSELLRGTIFPGYTLEIRSYKSLKSEEKLCFKE